MNDLVSVIMPSYNTESYIADSIQSVIDQTYQNWELIIVDDCSTDRTRERAASFRDERIILLKNEKNVGAASSRNYALRKAKGKWIAFLDSDDLWLPNKLEKQIRFMEDHNAVFSYTAYEDIDCNGTTLGYITRGPRRITRRGMYRYCWPGCLTVMYDAEKLGLLQIKDIPKHNDYAMWLKLCRRAECWFLNEVLAFYRRGRQDSVSTQRYATLIKWHYRLFRIEEEEGAIEAIYHTIGNLFFGTVKKLVYVKKK